MIVFKTYADIMKRQFPVVILYATILILLLSILSNTTQEKTFTGYEQTKVRIAVFNYDTDSELIDQLLSYLTEYCELVTISDQWQGQLDALYYRDVYSVLTIPTGFTQKIMNNEEVKLEITSLENTQEACYVNQAVNAYLDYVKFYILLDSTMEIQEVLKSVNEMVDTKVQVVSAGVESVNEENAQVNKYYNLLGFVLFVCIIVVVCSAMGAYQKRNIDKRHMIAPLPTASLNLQLLLANLVYTYMYTLLFLALFLAIGNEKGLHINTVFYWLNTFAYATSILFFAYFLTYWLKNKRMISVIANTIGLVLACMSGVFIRQEYLNEKLVKLASLMPVYWYIHGNDIIMRLSKSHIAQSVALAKTIGIQLLFAAMFCCLVLVVSKLDAQRK